MSIEDTPRKRTGDLKLIYQIGSVVYPHCYGTLAVESNAGRNDESLIKDSFGDAEDAVTAAISFVASLCIQMVQCQRSGACMGR